MAQEENSAKFHLTPGANTFNNTQKIVLDILHLSKQMEIVYMKQIQKIMFYLQKNYSNC